MKPSNSRNKLWLALPFTVAISTPIYGAELSAFDGTSQALERPITLVKQGPKKRYIIKFKAASTPSMLTTADATESKKKVRSKLLRSGFATNAKVIRQIATGAFVVEGSMKAGVSPLNMQQNAMASGEIEYIEEDRLLRHFAVPTDPSYSQQWHYYEATGGMNLPAAWDETTGNGAVVAVLDTGYRPHIDLVNNLLPGYDMISDDFVGNDGNGRDADARDPGDAASRGECGGGQPSQDQSSSWHGTHVAGTVAAETNNSTGVAGVAYNAKIVPVRVLGKCGGYTSDIADGMIWAAGGNVSGVPANANPAQVLNLSLGGGGSCDNTTQAAINTARNLGATVVVAAGNSNANAANYSPASCSGVITVAATNRNGGRAYYSNYGSVVEVAAPGGDVRSSASNGILSTLNSGANGPSSDNYAWYQGTSMASPHVAGLAALLYAADPNITPNEIATAIQQTARPFPASCSSCGAGIADAAAAVDYVLGNDGGGEPSGGFTETNLADTRRGWQYFTVEVPAGINKLDVTMSGGSGDADLYVRYGAKPSTRNWDYRPYLNGNNESVSVSNPNSGVWHIGVRAYSTYSGVTLQVSY
ncbi:peptidase S8 [Corallincola luteus]|uniref:Peptidase S8 n=1 Tax=Corallincola luteus TaxID=1775177 RepID=A0ABY2AKQ6_9GAMM|nr:S8 family peptidase [Corallincola luteus]TCI01984.1 peptidase S8 [Corallincola luteus]